MLDYVIYFASALLMVAFLFIIWNYAKGLKGSPREIYLLFFTKVTEYSAYGAINVSFILYLSKDMGLSDVAAGTFMGVYSVMLSFLVMIVGPFCDTLGIKKTLLVGAVTLLFSRLLMPFMPNLPLAIIFGFFPMAFGIAITGPVLSVGIKRFTTKETAALGFGLFYTLMNVGYAIGGRIFDGMRTAFGEHGVYNISEKFGISLPFDITLSTYQMIILLGFAINVPDFIAILMFRDGVELHDDGKMTITPVSVMSKGGNFFKMLGRTVAQTALKTWKNLANVFKEKSFWVFIGMLFLIVFTRLIFEHFHYTFPKYGIRLLGEGARIGTIYGVLNPSLIVFLVPLFSVFTRKISSFKVLLFGLSISATSVFIATIPIEKFGWLSDTWVGELVFDRWLNVPEHMRTPLYFSLMLFVIIFTIGEAFWSPRLMQFAATVAPKGKEASYVALAVLPTFIGKLMAGPLSGWLVSTYTPEVPELNGAPGILAAGEIGARYANHYMVWVFVGSIALITPIGLVIFRKAFKNAETHNEDEG
jgi:MFS family permease